MAKPPLPNGFEYLSDLGAGAFGEVVLARQISLDRLVAIKRIHQFALTDEGALERFRREGQVLAALRHPAVVKVYDFISTATGAVLVMEFVQGGSLSALLKSGGVQPSTGVRILRDVASALAAAAAAGVVHRDVKPANVFVLPDGRAKLGDFGLARVVTDPAVFRTTDGRSSGTPAYFPPEVSMGLAEPDERADAYSFAVMAYEVLTGAQPFLADGAMATIAAHWHRQARPPHELIPGFPPRASAAILAGLDKAPENRLLPMPLVDELSAVPAAEWPVGPPVSVATGDAGSTDVGSLSDVTRRVAPPPSVAGVLTAATGSGRRRRRRRTWLIGAAGLGVVAAVAILLAVTRSGDEGAAQAALSVRSVSVSTTPDSAQGRCPQAEFDFVAVIETNAAAGTVDVRWTRPDGRVTAVQHLVTVAGRSKVTAGLRFRVSGGRPLRGVAVAHVLEPTTIDGRSTSIDYRC
ncbi:MAG: eukaryotic-like serine/threonine-protein kinase [Pseudonocardiales bacterium]|jgi:hypothetical protein|nr:eukaryotic-like serine/threonine-protein kinase [Pseudonocardiales bacterium]